MSMDPVSLFLAHAIQLEQDAARRFEDLMHSMRTAGNQQVEALFQRLGELSRMHLRLAMTRGGFRSVPQLSPDAFDWPDGMTPEAAGWHGVDDGLDVVGALNIALRGERSGHDYYAMVVQTTSDPEVRALARSFEVEESQHVAELERWLLSYS